MSNVHSLSEMDKQCLTVFAAVQLVLVASSKHQRKDSVIELARYDFVQDHYIGH